MPAALSHGEETAIETFLADWVAENEVPGAAAAVVDGEGVVYAEGFGARDLESNAPATPATLFGVGSCTKTVTATAVHRLVADGDLAVGDHVDDYVPHLADAPGDPVTVGDLLTHTSGLPSDGSAGPLIARALGRGGAGAPLSSDDDLRRHVAGAADRRVTDRDVCFYYNSGYTVLGLVVEAVSGESFANHVADRVLDPLGMTRATFDRDAFEAETERMTPYVAGEDGPSATAFPFDDAIRAPGGLLCSVRDLAALPRLFLGEGTVDGTTLLAPDRVDAMTTPTGTFGTYLDGSEVGYGDGVMVEDYLGDRLVNHGGSVGVSAAWYGALEDAGLGVALACTTSPGTHPADAGMGVLALLRGEDPESVQPHYRLLSTIEQVTGEYASYRGLQTATVERVGGSLRVTVEGELGDQELLAVPDRIDGDTLVCATVLPSGMARPARFEWGDDGVSLFFERARFERAD